MADVDAVAKRDRIPVGLFQADLTIARQAVDNYQREAVRIQQAEAERVLMYNEIVAENQKRATAIDDLSMQLKDFQTTMDITGLLSESDYQRILTGAFSPLMKDKNGVIGKIKIIAKDKQGKGVFTFKWYQQKETLKIPHELFITDAELDWMKKYNHLGRIVYMDLHKNRNLYACYVSLDTELNSFFVLPANSVSIPKTIKGVVLSDMERKIFGAGIPLYLQSLNLYAIKGAIGGLTIMDSFDNEFVQKVREDTERFIASDRLLQEREARENSKSLNVTQESQQRNRGMRR